MCAFLSAFLLAFFAVLLAFLRSLCTFLSAGREKYIDTTRECTFLPVAAERYRKNATKGLTPFGNLCGLYVSV